MLVSCWTKGVFYKLRDKERSKESAYVLVGLLARPFVSFVSRKRGDRSDVQEKKRGRRRCDATLSR